MTENVEFDTTYEYSIYEDGIQVDTYIQIGARIQRFPAKIDTGSTFCVFERGHGEALGLEIEKGVLVDFGTATGSFRAFGHELTLTVLGIETVSTVYFAESDEFDRNVLGRIGWLDRIKLGLVDPESKLYLSRYT